LLFRILSASRSSFRTCSLSSVILVPLLSSHSHFSPRWFFTHLSRTAFAFAAASSASSSSSLNSAHAQRCLSSISLAAHSGCSVSLQWYQIHSSRGDYTTNKNVSSKKKNTKQYVYSPFLQHTRGLRYVVLAGAS
jgi:hypothetical protein